jgi:RimJ/RimL family protein N-acetyltransferase
MEPMFILITERLFLRHLQMSDAEAMYGVFGDPEVMRFGDGVQSKERVHNWLQRQIENYQAQGFGPYAIVEQHSDEVIGYCGLFFFPDVNGQPEVEIGYRLKPSTRGQGYATEAVLAVRDYAFTTLGLKRLIAMIDPGNVASIRVAEKAGMKYEQDVLFEGYDHPDHIYAVTSN